MPTSFDHDNPKLAQTYDRLSDSQFEGGKRLVERIGIAPGAHVLDIGCGTGRLARFLAERVGPSGKVVGIDPLPERIAIAREHGSSATFEVGQAEDLRAFADESFDAVCMSAVIHWLSDKPAALAEVRRVLRPGGKLGVTTLPKELVGEGTVAAVLRSVLAQPPYAEMADLDALPFANRGHTVTETIEMLLAARLSLKELLVMERARTHATGTDVVDFLDSSSFGNFLCVVPEDLRPSLKTDLARGFDAQKGPDGVVMRDWGMAFVVTRR